MTTADRLKNIFVDVFELDGDAAVEQAEYRGIPEWDSVAHMALVAEIEDTFDIMLDTDQVIDMSSFDKAVAIIDTCLA